MVETDFKDMNNKTITVFISYQHYDFIFADEFYQYYKGRDDIKPHMDDNDLKYGQSIRLFMETAGDTDILIALKNDQ